MQYLPFIGFRVYIFGIVLIGFMSKVIWLFRYLGAVLDL